MMSHVLFDSRRLILAQRLLIELQGRIQGCIRSRDRGLEWARLYQCTDEALALDFLSCKFAPSLDVRGPRNGNIVSCVTDKWSMLQPFVSSVLSLPSSIQSPCLQKDSRAMSRLKCVTSGRVSTCCCTRPRRSNHYLPRTTR